MRWDSVNYYVKSGVALFTFPDEPDYFSQDYDEEDYYASEEVPIAINLKNLSETLARIATIPTLPFEVMTLELRIRTGKMVCESVISSVMALA